MNETRVVLCGNVASDVRHHKTDGDVSMAKFRLAVTKSRRDAGTGDWEDVHTSFYSVTAFRSLAQNVLASVTKGDPVMVTGELRVSEYLTKEGESRLAVEIEAVAVGHDLSRGTSSFRRMARARLVERHRDGSGDADSATGEVPAEAAAA